MPPRCGMFPQRCARARSPLCQSTVRVHMPMGKAAGCKSSAQNALIAQAARGPETTRAVLRCDTSTTLGARIIGAISPSASRRNSSGPSHNSAQSPLVMARQCPGSARPVAASAAASPRMISRVAGGSAASCTVSTGGRCSGQRRQRMRALNHAVACLTCHRKSVPTPARQWCGQASAHRASCPTARGHQPPAQARSDAPASRSSKPK